MQFLSMVESMPLSIVPFGSRELKEATTLIRKYSDRHLTLTDAAGLHLMTSRRIRMCWSTDFHLGLTGVPLVVHI